jgi:hypothetical protein
MCMFVYVCMLQEHFSKKLTSIKNTYLQEATRKQFEAANIASSAEYKRGEEQSECHPTTTDTRSPRYTCHRYS